MASGAAEAVDQGRSGFFPILIGLVGPSPDSDTDRVVLVNPVTQAMFVLQGGAAMVSELLSGGGGTGGAPPASKASIEALRSVDPSELAEGSEECSVCLDGLKEEEEEEEEGGKAAGVVKEMPCGHRFHGACVERWLRMHGSCPVCRFQMPIEEKEAGKKEGGGEETELDESERGRERRSTRQIWVSITINSSSERRRDDAAAASEQGDQGEDVSNRQMDG